MKIQSFAYTSLLAYDHLRSKVEKFPDVKSFRLAYISSSRRFPERERMISEIEKLLERIFEVLNSSFYPESLAEYSVEMKRKFTKDYPRIKRIRISDKKLQEFENKLKVIEKELRKINELYPLSLYISKVLEIYPEMVRMDYKLMKEMKRKEYLELAKIGFEIFPEKVIIFHAPVIALYFVFDGYRRMNLLQLSRLTGIFHKFIHMAMLPEKKGVVKLGEEFKKLPAFVKR